MSELDRSSAEDKDWIKFLWQSSISVDVCAGSGIVLLRVLSHARILWTNLSFVITPAIYCY